MANEIRYQVGFDVKQGDLSKLKSSLQQLQKLKISDVMKINSTDAASATTMLTKIKTQAKNVEDALKNAFNAKLNTVNIQSFNRSLRTSGTTIQQIYKAFSSAGTSGENAFRSLSSQVLSTNIQLKQTHGLLDKMATTLTNTIKWNVASGAVNSMSRAVEQAWGYTKSLDTSLNNIRIVTGKSAEEMGNFAIKANEAAQSLGKTTTDYTNAALIYAQQGLSDQEIEERARITLMTANVTGQSTSDVSEELTAVWNGYKVSAEEAELYIDRLAAVAATTASDLEELSIGMSKVASAAAALGVGEDQLAAQLSTIISVTRQAPESVGTALRTVYARISDIKAGIDEDGVTLGNYSGKMAELGFNVLDAAGNLRDMGEVMEDIGSRWQDLTREQQISLAQTMAGQRQYSNLIALFDNFEKYNEALNTAQNAAGTLQKQQDIYMESTAAHLQTLKAAVENIYDSLADTDSINSIADGLVVAANLTANLIDSLGGGSAVLKSLGAIGVTVFSEQIAKGINTTITNLEIGRDNAMQFDQALEAAKDWQGIPGLDDTSKKLLENKEQLLDLARLMTPEQFSGMQQTLNDITNLGNEIAGLEDKVKPLQNVINLVSDQKLENVVGKDIQDQITKDIQSFMNLAQAIEETQNNFNALDFSKSGKKIKNDFKDIKTSIDDYMGQIDLLNQQGFLNEHQAELQKITEAYNNLPKNIRTEEAKQKYADFFNDLKELALNGSAVLSPFFEDLLSEFQNADLTTALEKRKQELQQLVNSFVTGQERMKRAADIENWAKMAGGVAQVGSAIQQIQNLGSIWKNSDLSGGQKLLQTITNLSISLPMLASGFTKATTALGLMKTMTTAEAVAAGISSTAQTAHAISIGMVETASGAAAVKVQLLNTTLMLNPFVAAAAGVIALATAFGTLINATDAANKSQQEFYQSEIEKYNKTQEQIEKNKELYTAIDELNKKYEDGEITRIELKSSIDDLITKYGLEKQAADKLTNSYKNLNESIREARLQAAKDAEESAKKELNDAEQNIFTTAKNKASDSGRQVADQYILSLSQGAFGGDEPEKLQNALKRIGGQGGGGSITFNTNFDLNSLLTLYDNINKVITNIQPLLTAEEKQASDLYQNTVKWLQQMQPQIEAYRDALKDVVKYQKDRVALQAETNNKINFQNIQSSNDYIQQRKTLIEEYKQLLESTGDAQSDPAAMADTYISEYYSELYKKFDEVANYIDNIRDKFGGSNSFIETLLGQLDEQHFTALMDLVALHPSVIHDWESLGKAIHYISEQDFSNINNLPQIQGNVADQYNIYQSLEDQVSGGKTINAKELERLTPEVQEFFSMMANGSYKMTGNAKEFYETVNSLKLDGFKTALAQINSQIDKTENLQNQNFNYKELDKQAYKGAPFADYGAVDYDLAQKQLDYLQVVSSGNAEMQVAIQLWQEQIDKQNLSKEAINEIAEAIANAKDQTGNLDEKTKELKQNADELAHQLHDAMFPTDADVNIEALESLSETIQDIATESEELANSLQTDARASEDVAESILRFDDAIEDVIKNYDNWMDALKNGSIQEQAEIINDLRDAYADLLDLDGSALSNDFLTNVENLDLMKAAIDGDIEAYDELLSKAGQDIAATVHLDTTQFETDFQNLMNLYYEGQSLDDLQIGASLNNEKFLQGLSDMVTAAGMTAQQVTDYLSSMGVDAEVVEQKSQGTETKTQTGWESTLVPNTQIGEVPIVSGTGGETTITPMPITFTTYSSQYTPTTEEVTDTKENSAFSLKVISAHKSSGGKFKFNQAKNGGGSKGTARRSGGGKKGGGGGGGKAAKPNTSQKETKEPLKNQVDLYHDINIELGDLNRKLDNTQKKQDRLYGKNLIDNLNEQNGILDQQIGKLEQKYQLQKKDQSQKQEELKELGVVFDGYGKIGNYMDILETKQVAINELIKQYNLLIQQYNQTTDDERKKELNQQISELDKKNQHEKQKMDALQKGMDDYDKLMDDMQDNEDEREAKRQEQFENNIRKFRTKIEIRLDMGEAERDWNNFRRNVLNHSDILKESDFDKLLKDAAQNYQDVLSYFDINGQMGTLEALTNQLLATQDELDEINGGGESSIYGNNKKQAMQDLKTDLNELMQQMQDVEGLIDSIDKAYLNTIDDIMDQFDKQINDYKLIGELIEHDMDLLSLLYGDRNYDAMDRYYSTLRDNNLQQLDSLKQQRDFWKQEWDKAVARGDSEAAKKFEEHYKDTIGNLNSLIEQSAQNLLNKYVNAIDGIFDALDKKISNGLGTNYLSAEWQLMRKNADEYLDTINSAFALQDLENKFNDALNDTKSLKAQQAIKTLMDAQLENLRTKEKLTEYDVERAEKLLQIEQARIALEDAQASKTSMRLKRDSQGNYSYEYVADQGDIAEAEQGLAAAQNDLYNFDKDRYQSNLDDMLSAWQEFQERYKEIVTDVSLSEEERVANLALLREQYGQYINDKTAENLVVRTNLMESAFADIATIYDTDVENYNQMADNEKNILMGDLVPAWQSGIQQMADKVAGQGGFIPTCEEAFENITEATEDYKDELDDMARVAGMSLDDVKQGVDVLADSFGNLVEKNDDLLDRMSQELTSIESLKDAVRGLKEQYDDVYEAAKRAASAIHGTLQDTRADAIENDLDDEDDDEDIRQRYTDDSKRGPGVTFIEGGNGPSTIYNESLKYATDDQIKASTLEVRAYGNTDSSLLDLFTSQVDTGIRSTVSTLRNNISEKINEKLKRISSLDSGGYTGQWSGDSGKLALLHQKELVLNPGDTTNLLNSVEILRSMMNSLDGNLFARANNIKSGFFNTSNDEDSLEQNVHIDASFPNVNSKREIEEAFSDLVNLAAQRAMRR